MPGQIDVFMGGDACFNFNELIIRILGTRKRGVA